MVFNQSIYTAQLNLTQAHLWFEEKLHGDEAVKLSQVELYFNKAQASLREIVHILNHFNQYTFLKTKETQTPANSLLKINQHITQLKQEASERWKVRSEKLVTAKYDIQFDRHFNKILTEIMHVKLTLDKILSHATARHLRLQLITLSFWMCLLLATVSASIYLEKKRQQQELKTNILADFPKESPLPTLQFSENGTILYSNEPGASIAKEWNPPRGVPQVWLERIQNTLDKNKVHEYEYHHKNASYIIKLSPSKASNSVYFYAVDITKRNEAIKKMEYLIYHDQLTGLPNRQQAENLLNQAVTQSKQHKQKLALIILDINNFKSINDNYGRKKGDKILQLMAERLNLYLKQDELISQMTKRTSISRVDGDKFSLILEDIKNSHDAGFICERILRGIEDPLILNKNESYNITVSAGISIYPFIKQPSSHLFSFSEEALKKAKKIGRNSYQYYTKKLYQQHTSMLQLEHDLSLAIEKNEFSLVYQPQIRLTDLMVIGAEVLIRWQHPDKGFISPAEFIPVAEHCGQIAAIEAWVIRNACQQWGQWAKQGIKLPKLAINLSSTQLNKSHYIEDINQIVTQSGLSKNNIEFEITETSIMQQGAAVSNFLYDLKNAGYELSIDDFGTGYSSLDRLKKLPVNLLKIDKSFIDDLSENSEDYFIVKTIIALAHSLNLWVLAEGVETNVQVNVLRQLNCDIIQGYIFSKPLSPQDFLTFLGKKIIISK